MFALFCLVLLLCSVGLPSLSFDSFKISQKSKLALTFKRKFQTINIYTLKWPTAHRLKSISVRTIISVVSLELWYEINHLMSIHVFLLPFLSSSRKHNTKLIMYHIQRYDTNRYILRGSNSVYHIYLFERKRLSFRESTSVFYIFVGFF